MGPEPGRRACPMCMNKEETAGHLLTGCKDPGRTAWKRQLHTKLKALWTADQWSCFTKLTDGEQLDVLKGATEIIGLDEATAKATASTVANDLCSLDDRRIWIEGTSLNTAKRTPPRFSLEAALWWLEEQWNLDI